MANEELAIKPLRARDCEALLTWVDSADALLQWAGPRDFSWPLTSEQLLTDLHGADHRRMPFAAVRPEDGSLVGHVMLTTLPDHDIGLLGRVIVAPDQRGRGFGTALMEEVVRFGFDQRGLHRLQLAVYDFNLAAIACYESVGFVIEGTQRDATRSSNGYWTSHAMALLEPSYRARRSSGSDGGGIRVARMTDAEALAELLTDLGYPHDEGHARARLRQWAGDAQGSLLVAEQEERVVGFIAVHAIPCVERAGYFARVTGLSVRPDCQGSGIGRRLLGAAEEWAKAHGCNEVEVTSRRTRTGAHAFYRRLGYEDVCDRAARFTRKL
jgi:RimJ/RimL family protein N-acetyltransferase